MKPQIIWHPKRMWKVLKAAGMAFQQHDTWTLGAALSYYTVFSLAPILIIVIALTGVLFGKDAVSGQIYEQIRGLLGDNTATQIQDMIKSAYQPGRSVFTSVIATILLIYGSTSIFTQLQTSLNTIWGVKSHPKKGLIKYIRDRVLSFTLVIAMGFLMLVSLVINALLVALSKYFQGLLPETSLHIFRIGETLFSFIVITFIFAMIYKSLPDVKIKWKYVWAGAIFTAIFFVLGKYIIGFYIGNSRISTTYGAAASIVFLLIWVYYSSQILFFGAEFTQAYTHELGGRLFPTEYAVQITNIILEQGDNETNGHFEKEVHKIEHLIKHDQGQDKKKNSPPEKPGETKKV